MLAASVLGWQQSTHLSARADSLDAAADDGAPVEEPGVDGVGVPGNCKERLAGVRGFLFGKKAGVAGARLDSMVENWDVEPSYRRSIISNKRYA